MENGRQIVLLPAVLIYKDEESLLGITNKSACSLIGLQTTMFHLHTIMRETNHRENLKGVKKRKKCFDKLSYEVGKIYIFIYNPKRQTNREIFKTERELKERKERNNERKKKEEKERGGLCATLL